MHTVANEDTVYIVMSQTGSYLSRLLKIITGAEYNHISLGFNPDLNTMYSFGRRHAYNPFVAGFVVESPDFGTFKRFSNTKVMVLSLDIGSDKYKKIEELFHFMEQHKREYRYNFKGLLYAYFNIYRSYNNKYYCSEFLRYVFQEYSVTGSENLGDITRPVDFLDLPSIKEIYTGRLADYKEFYNSQKK